MATYVRNPSGCVARRVAWYSMLGKRERDNGASQASQHARTADRRIATDGHDGSGDRGCHHRGAGFERSGTTDQVGVTIRCFHAVELF
jgi:hypothetical protein